MASERIVAGLIGAGRIGKMHAELLGLRLPGVFLKAVAEHRLDREWAARRGIPVAGTHEEVVLDDPEIEVVLIAASTPAHLDLVTAAAAAGKHVFCEKPMGIDAAEIMDAAARVSRAGRLLQVGFNRRFDPDVRRLAERLRAGEIGEVHMVIVTNRDPRRPPLDFVRASGGLFMDFSIHDFDMVRFLTGDEVVEAFAAGAALVDPAIGEAGDVDTALITLRLAGGAFALVDNSRETRFGYDQRIEVHGDAGSLRLENRRPTAVVAETGEHVRRDPPHATYVERYRDSYAAQLEAFFDCVRSGRTPAVGGADAAAAVAVAHAALRSQRTKARVAVEGPLR